MLRAIIRALFYPTLFYNRLMCALGVWSAWDWIDEHVAIGSLPTARRLAALADEGVGGVINLCEEYAGNKEVLSACGIEQLHLVTLDYHPPTEADALQALAFIDGQIGAGKKVYIHCKAGRGRSATIVLCYLIARNGYTPEEADKQLRSIRPHVDKSIHTRDVVQAVAQRVQQGERLLQIE